MIFCENAKTKLLRCCFFLVKSKCEHLFLTNWEVFLVKSKWELLFWRIGRFFFVKSKCEHLFWTIWQVFLVKSKCELLLLQFWQVFSVMKIIRLFEKCRFFRATFSPLIWTDVYFTKVNNFLTVILVHFEAIECQKSLKEAFFFPVGILYRLFACIFCDLCHRALTSVIDYQLCSWPTSASQAWLQYTLLLALMMAEQR